MEILPKLIFEFLRLIFRSKQDIVLKNLALRQQLAVQQRSIKRPKFKNTDRFFWVCLSRLWNNWRSSLIIVNGTTKYVIRDNDAIISKEFKETIKRFRLKDTPTAPRSLWQNPICERVIGTLRRECLDHMIILNEKHLYDVLHEYICEYYNVSRTHMSLHKDSPIHRPAQINGKIANKPILGGLHHLYSRVA